MKSYSENDNYKLYQGNMLDMLDVIESNSIDSIVTDPPYELNFMNKGWDNSGIAFQVDTWKKCYEVLKPGAYLLAFGGTRTFHRIACAIEDVGFEIRDTIMWLYGSGFPKSMNIGLAIDKKNGVESEVVGTRKHHDFSRHNGSMMNFSTAENLEAKTSEFEERVAQNEWAGWGTALKPSYEPIIVARKPLEGTCVDNVLKYGVGGINIDECRIEHNEPIKITNRLAPKSDGTKMGKFKENGILASPSPNGRFPANTILTYDETDEQEVCGGFPDTKANPNVRHNHKNGKGYNCYGNYGDCDSVGYDDEGSASRYFYNGKQVRKIGMKG